MSARDKVIGIIADQAGLSGVDILDDTPLVDGDGALGLDSLDRVELAMELEDEFAIEIDDDTVASWKTAGDVINAVVGAPV